MEIEPVDLSQNIENDLSKYADEQRKKLVPKKNTALDKKYFVFF